MKPKSLVISLIVVGLVVGGLGLGVWKKNRGIVSPVPKVTEKPLDKYSFQNLKDRAYTESEINFYKLLQTNKDWNEWMFSFFSDGKKVSGTSFLPSDVSTASALTKPIIIMLRGYADPKEYYPGFGTERVAIELAKNGFVTLAPDFLGYGESASPSANAFEDRFQTYTTTLNLISSVQSNFIRQMGGSNFKLGLWGHSNGGQIALSVLAISGKLIPTVLWNPVSITFPYSILYYTWDNDDQGKAMRKTLADFEKDYDSQKYDPANYYSWITAPILLQQGGADDQVPQKWLDTLASSIKRLAVSDIEYKVYPGADHNMIPVWNTAVNEAIEFYKSTL